MTSFHQGTARTSNQRIVPSNNTLSYLVPRLVFHHCITRFADPSPDRATFSIEYKKGINIAILENAQQMTNASTNLKVKW